MFRLFTMFRTLFHFSTGRERSRLTEVERSSIRVLGEDLTSHS